MTAASAAARTGSQALTVGRIDGDREKYFAVGDDDIGQHAGWVSGAPSGAATFAKR